MFKKFIPKGLADVVSELKLYIKYTSNTEVQRLLEERTEALLRTSMRHDREMRLPFRLYSPNRFESDSFMSTQISNLIKNDDAKGLEDFLLKIQEFNGPFNAMSARCFLIENGEILQGEANKTEWFSVAVYSNAKSCIVWALNNGWASVDQKTHTDSDCDGSIYEIEEWEDRALSYRDLCWRLKKFDWVDVFNKTREKWLVNSKIYDEHGVNKFLIDGTIDRKFNLFAIETYESLVNFGEFTWSDILVFAKNINDLPRMGQSKNEIGNLISVCEKRLLTNGLEIEVESDIKVKNSVL